MDLIKTFFENNEQDLRTLLESAELPCKEDRSGYIYVDGEEGDYGVIKYYAEQSGIHIATKVIEGGDVEWVEFTEYGATLMQNLLITYIMEWVKKAK